MKEIEYEKKCDCGAKSWKKVKRFMGMINGVAIEVASLCCVKCGMPRQRVLK